MTSHQDKYYDHEEATTAFAAEATGVVADKVAEEGLKLFTHGIKRIVTSRVFQCGALLLHLVIFIIGGAAVGVGTTSVVIGTPPSLLNCTLTRSFGVTQAPYSVSLFLLLSGVALLILVITVGLLVCCKNCCSCDAEYAASLIVLALIEILAWLGYAFYYLPDAFFDWLDDRDSCSDLIMIFTVSVTLFTVIVAVIYVVTIIIGICYGLYLKCCTHKV